MGSEWKDWYQSLSEDDVCSVSYTHLLEGLQDGLKKNEAQENEDLKKYKSIIQKEGYTRCV